jgi:putative RNA 2'-phosphotransferase
VRRSHVNEVFMTARGKPFLLEGNKIAAVSHHPELSAGEETAPPKLLYHCVRRRAYPVVCRQGIGATKERRVLLATSEALATRMGKRQDPVPVLLTVQAEKAFEAGTRFFRHGELIYAADHVPVDYFVGPPLPSEKRKEASKGNSEPIKPTQPLAGSVTFDPGRSEALFKQPGKEKGAKKEVGWKRDVRRLRRQRRRSGAKRGKT